MKLNFHNRVDRHVPYLQRHISNSRSRFGPVSELGLSAAARLRKFAVGNLGLATMASIRPLGHWTFRRN